MSKGLKTGLIITGILLVLLTVLCLFLGLSDAKKTVSVTGVKSVSLCEDVVIVAWSTDKDCVCQVYMCYAGQCFITDKEPESGTLHLIALPTDAKDVEIRCIGADGQESKTKLW